jgi:hypothetical protein
LSPQAHDVPHFAGTQPAATAPPPEPTAAGDPAATVVGTVDALPVRDAASAQVAASDDSSGDGAKATAVFRRSIPIRIAGAVLFVLSPLRPVALLIAKAVPWVLMRVPVGVGAMVGFTTAAALIHFHVLAIPLAITIGAVIAAVRPTAVIVNFFQQPVVNDLASGPGALLTKIPVVGNFFALLPLVPGAAKLTRWGALRRLVENGALAMTPGLGQARAAYRVGRLVHSTVSASAAPDLEKARALRSMFFRVMRRGFRVAFLGLRFILVSGILTLTAVWSYYAYFFL